jgi:3-oxoadipate enol-lactonase
LPTGSFIFLFLYLLIPVSRIVKRTVIALNCLYFTTGPKKINMHNVKEIQVKGNRVSYVDEGQGTAVVFIHGFPFTKETWDHEVNALKQKYRCIAYDVRGHGGTPGTLPEFSISQFADDLIDFMDALHIRRAVLCGLSMGGYIALHAVEKAPARFIALVLCDTQCKADTEEARDKRMRTISFIQENGLEKYADESVKSLFAPASLQVKKKEVDFIKNTILNSEPSNVCKTLMALANRKNTCPVLRGLTIPVLILVGTEDKVTPPAAAQFMHEQLSTAKLHTIAAAGHLSNLENPEEFMLQLELFLEAATA